MVKQKTQNKQKDWFLLSLAVVGVLASLVAFYVLSPSQTLLIRVLILLAGSAVSVVVLLQSSYGHQLLFFLRETRIELIKVVWPQRSETVRTTAIVMVAVFIIGLFLWLVDTLLFWLVELLIG